MCTSDDGDDDDDTGGAETTAGSTTVGTTTSGTSASTGTASSTTTGSTTSATGGETGDETSGSTSESGEGEGTSTSTSDGGDAGDTDTDGEPAACPGVPLPLDQHFVADDLCASMVADDQDKLRQITFAPNADLWGVTADGVVRRYRDADGDGMFFGAEIVDWAHTGGNGNNVHIDAEGGYVYAGSPAGVVRWVYDPEVDEAGEPEAVLVGQPGDGNHSLHTVHVYAGWLYVHSGSAGNADAPMSPNYDTNRSLLRRFDLAAFDAETPFTWAGDGENVAVGLRNMVGYTWDDAGRLYGVVNGIDDLAVGGIDVHKDNPGDALVRIEMGEGYGFPYCFTAQRIVRADNSVVEPGTQLATELVDGTFDNPRDDAWCGLNSNPPVTFLQAHSAPLDLLFFGDEHPVAGLPERWRGGAFVAVHGSWNRQPATGYKVVWIPFDENGAAPMPESTPTTTTFPFEVVLGAGSAEAGHEDGPWGWNVSTLGESMVRPVGVAIHPIDGTLYVSSDNAPVFMSGDEFTPNGSIYRIALKP